MAFCHGNGNPQSGGCCFVDGAPCPHRLDAAGLAAFIDTLNLTGQKRTRAQNLLQGVTFACGIVVKLLANDTSLWSNNAALTQAWNNDPAYVAFPGSRWRQLEQEQGRPAGSYQCSSWGIPSGECCFSETPAVNAARAAALHPTVVTVRRSRGN